MKTPPKLLAVWLLLPLAVQTAAGQQPGEDEVIGWFNAAKKYQATGEYRRALPLYQKVLGEAPRLWGEGSENHANTLNNLAVLYRDMGQYTQAEPLYRRCLEIREAKFGKDHPDTASALGNLAVLYSDMAQYAQAEPLFRRGLEILEAKLGKDHPATALALNNLAVLYQDMGQYAQAESLHRRSLEIREAKLGKDHLDTAQSLNNLAILYRAIGQYAQAEPLFRRGLEIHEAKLGKDHLQIASPLNNLALLYRDMGQYAQAEPLYRRSLEIKEAKLGKDHPDTALALSNLANLYQDMGQYAQAESLHRRSLEIREAKLGKDHPHTAQSLNNLAQLYRDMGQYAQAEPLQRRSLEIHETKLGKNHSDTASILNNLALLYRDMGQYAQAEPLFRRCLEIKETRLGKDHPDIAGTLSNLAWLFTEQQNWVAAREHVQSARRILARHIAGVLASLGEKEQSIFLAEKVQKRFELALSLGRQAGPRDAATAEAAAGWLVNGKGLIHQTLAERQLLARDATNPQAQALVQQLQQSRAALAALLQRLPRPGEEAAYHVERTALQHREQDLARRLAEAVQRPYRADPWIEPAELRKKLSQDAILIDLARFRMADFKQMKFRAARYVAWLTPPEGKGAIQLIDLGEAAPIDQAVQAARDAILRSPGKIQAEGEPAAIQEIRPPLEALAKLVLHPLLESIGAYREWIVCPDGALWLVPWNALPFPDGKFAVEKHVLRHIISGRDLVLANPKVEPRAAALFADPDFDLAPAVITAQARGLLRGLGVAPSLLGQRLKGTIGNWNISFEFREAGRLLIYDEDDGARLVGEGTWSQQGDQLTMQTKKARFEGTIRDSLASGRRTTSDATDRWQFRLPVEESASVAELRSIGSAAQVLPRVRRLPGTAAEAAALEPRIKALTGQTPQVHSGAAAGEAVVKAVMRPRILVLSTHGYFLPDQEVQRKDKDLPLDTSERRSAPLLDTKGVPIENPLLRCGLLLAGCNRREQAKPAEEDGVLTGLEIVGLDLRGTELVVLSACETGLGDVRNGEGVAGLRQAFQLAGAQAVVATLWQIPDRDSALLMQGFFDRLAAGDSRADALCAAQRARIESRRRRNGAAHPFFWAAYTLTGQ